MLGYLIAGAVIGPFALSLVGEQQDVMRFAEFGEKLLPLWRDEDAFILASREAARTTERLREHRERLRPAGDADGAQGVSEKETVSP